VTNHLSKAGDKGKKLNYTLKISNWKTSNKMYVLLNWKNIQNTQWLSIKKHASFCSHNVVEEYLPTKD